MTSGFQQQSLNVAPILKSAKRPQHIGQVEPHKEEVPPAEPRSFAPKRPAPVR